MPELSIVDILHGHESPVEWLIPDFLPMGSLVMLGGEACTGKSYLSYTLSLALATGTPVLGWDLSPRRVLYFDQENSRADCIQYLRWAWNGLGQPDIELADENLRFVHFGLSGAAWPSQMAIYVNSHRPQLIVVDTTTPACDITDENDNAEASRTVLHFRQIQALGSPQPTILALKHARVNSQAVQGTRRYTLRGAKAWEGMADSVIFQLRAPGHPRSDGLTNTRLEPAKTRAFGLRKSLYIEPTWTPDHEGLVLQQVTAPIPRRHRRKASTGRSGASARPAAPPVEPPDKLIIFPNKTYDPE